MKVDSELFNFEFVTEDEITRDVRAAAESINAQYLNEAIKMREMILPLLHNLAQKPDNEYIKWPNRVETINKFIHQLFEVTQETPSEEDLV